MSRVPPSTEPELGPEAGAKLSGAHNGAYEKNNGAFMFDMSKTGLVEDQSVTFVSNAAKKEPHESPHIGAKNTSAAALLYVQVVAFL